MSDLAFPHYFPFDPSYGYTLEGLLAIRPPQPPADFAAFWERRYRGAVGLPTRPRVSPATRANAGWAVHDLAFGSTDGVEIGGWLLTPVQGPIRRGLVVGHGYGGRDAPDLHLPVEAAAVLFPCFRGMGRSRLPGVSDEPYWHVLHDIQDRDRYLIGGCVADLWLAVSALLALFPQVAGHVGYMGTSFGGGVGALAAPWDARITRLQLEVPTFGHHPLRLQLPSVGSGEAVRRFQRHSAFNVLETLAYYDAAAAAGRLRIPTHVAAARFDPAVPPPGQFAIHNAVPAPWRRSFVLDAGHFDHPGRAAQQAALFNELQGFFRNL
jgi:cephalosporin-C deacetylase